MNEQANEHCRLLIQQMVAVEGVTENLKHRAQWEWVRAMNSIASRVEEIIKSEMIYVQIAQSPICKQKSFCDVRRMVIALS